MQTLTSFLRSRFLYASPWLLTAAAGLLIIIIVTFAFHNLRLEKRLMTNAMMQKAATLIKAVQSGARASYLADVRNNFWESDPWHSHVQKVIDHLVEDTDIMEIALFDEQGSILAHSDQQRIGTKRSLDSEMFHSESEAEESKVYISILPQKEGGRVFVAEKRIRPILVGGMRKPTHHHERGMFFFDRKRQRPPAMGMFFERSKSSRPFFLLVGLDMHEYEQTLGRLRLQIVILSLAMLLVGLAGWFSLSMVQGYRVSQKTLNAIQAFTSLLITTLPVGIIATDKSGRIATWNQAVDNITGISDTEALGKKPHEILPPALAVFFDDAPRRHHPAADDEQEVRLADRYPPLVLLCRLIQIYDNNKVCVGDVLLLSDISKVKRLEQKMRESERLAAIGRMAGGVAHEVRNPLSSIKGLGLLLKNSFLPGSKEHDTADLLIQETDRMNRTITEMLSFTRPSSLSLQPVDVRQLLEKEIELIRAESEDNAIAIELRVQEGLRHVHGDKDRLTQVLMNILLNSIQAMPDGGSLSLEAESVEQGEWVQIIIRDTGQGMDEAILAQVFYPYFTTKKKGTGIGLAISQKIILDHGGTITVASEAGQGTTVTLLLPAADPGRKK